MTIDPQLAGLLDQLKAQGVPDFSEMDVAQARGFVGAFIDFEGEAEPVAEVKDLTIDGPAGDLVVRVYRPVAEDGRPVIAYFHGGGYVTADVQIADKPARQLANATGCVVVSVEYRLAPESKAPAAAEDCYAATQWIAHNGDAVGGDASRLAVSGDSAGGGIAAAVALMARDRGAPSLALQLLLYPITDQGGDWPSLTQNGEGYLLSHRALKWFSAHNLADPADADNPYISPIRASELAGLPSAIVVTAGYDPLRDMGDAYAAKLDAANVPIVHLPNPSMIHGFMWLGGVCDHTKTVYDHVGQLVREQLNVDT